MTEPFRVLEADPPWRFDDAIGTRGADAKYPTLGLDEIKAFELPPLADDALLLLWRVASMQQEALDVVRAWGFEVKSEIVWVKRTRLGALFFGMGRYVRGSHEVCLVATRGKWKPKSRSVRSVFSAPVGRHSAKPERFYDEIVPELAHGPFVSLFSRRFRPGWTCFGNELPEALRGVA